MLYMQVDAKVQTWPPGVNRPTRKKAFYVDGFNARQIATTRFRNQEKSEAHDCAKIKWDSRAQPNPGDAVCIKPE
jgi:hypothetical protein